MSAKANRLNHNDLCRFIRQELCRLFGGMGWLGSGNFGQCWPKLGGVRSLNPSVLSLFDFSRVGFATSTGFLWSDHSDVLRYIVCKLGASEIFGHISLSWNEVAVRRKGPDAECDEARIRTAGGFCRVIKYFIEEALSKLPLIRSRSWRCFRGTASIFIPRWLRSNPLSWYFFHLPCLYDFLNTILAAFTTEDYTITTSTTRRYNIG